MSRTHRVNLAWLCDVIENGGSVGITCVKRQQQRADIFKNCFTIVDVWDTLLSAIALLHMKQSDCEHAHVSYIHSKGGIVMETRQSVDDYSGANPHCKQYDHTLTSSSSCMFVLRGKSMSHPLPLLASNGSCQTGGAAKLRPGADVLLMGCSA